ncbi:MAG: sll0787 family AIR synthase-like protein [Methyloligella sp. ZOD6]
MTLHALAESLRRHPSIRGKLAIGQATGMLGLRADSFGRPGDDAAILPRAGEGCFDLLAGEGFIQQFVSQDPWFAGWCGVMVNLSDIAAMGGRAVALVNQVWAPSPGAASPLLDGLRSASAAYGVPIVGGHTNLDSAELGLAVTAFGRAERLITSFDAEPGDLLIAAIDKRGSYRPPYDNFCAALDAPPERLQSELKILAQLAEAGLVLAGKDISQGGIVGTALMLAECSCVGIRLDLDAIEPPKGVTAERWLHSFPSFGFLLSVKPNRAPAVINRFTDDGIDAATIGTLDESSTVTLSSGGSTALFWDWHADPYLHLATREAIHA